MLQWYRNEQTNTEKDNILNGLSCSKDITNLKGWVDLVSFMSTFISYTLFHVNSYM